MYRYSFIRLLTNSHPGCREYEANYLYYLSSVVSIKGALYWIHSQNSTLVSWPIRHVTYKIKSPLLTAYTATQNIVPQEEHEIKVSLQICVVYTLGYITLGQAPPSLMLILAAREIQDITPLKIRSRKSDVVP